MANPQTAKEGRVNESKRLRGKVKRERREQRSVCDSFGVVKLAGHHPPGGGHFETADASLVIFILRIKHYASFPIHLFPCSKSGPSPVPGARAGVSVTRGPGRAHVLRICHGIVARRRGMRVRSSSRAQVVVLCREIAPIASAAGARVSVASRGAFLASKHPERRGPAGDAARLLAVRDASLRVRVRMARIRVRAG